MRHCAWCSLFVNAVASLLSVSNVEIDVMLTALASYCYH